MDISSDSNHKDAAFFRPITVSQVICDTRKRMRQCRRGRPVVEEPRVKNAYIYKRAKEVATYSELHLYER
jgi:hypothetical protein